MRGGDEKSLLDGATCRNKGSYSSLLIQGLSKSGKNKVSLWKKKAIKESQMLELVTEM